MPSSNELYPSLLDIALCKSHGVSKDGCWHDLACGGPARRAQERAPQDEDDDDDDDVDIDFDIDMIRTSETMN
jgi:hypothetical protein